MGSGNSRMARSRSSRPRADNRTRHGLASFLCGASSASPQMDDQSADKLVSSASLHSSILADNLQDSVKESLSIVSPETSCSSSVLEHARSCQTSNFSLKESFMDLRNDETCDSGKCFSKSKEIVPSTENCSSGLDWTHSEITCDLASSSSKPEPLEPLLENMVTSIAPIMDVHESTNECTSQTCTVRCSSSTSANGTSSTESPAHEVSGIPISVSTSASDSFVSGRLLEDEPLRGETPSVAASLISSGPGEQRNGSVLHVDVLSISSTIIPSGSGEISINESRRNNRRLFWDAFSRHSSRRNNDSPSIFLSTEDTDDLGSHERWLLDFSDDIFESGVEDDSVYLHHRRFGRRWHSRSEIRERLRGGLDEIGGRTTYCASGLHQDGTCSCETLLVGEGSSTRASISRIVMLAEALFEVLDEIHRQPVSLALSMVSLPAPESVVDSFPLKSHRKLSMTGSGDAVEQCYICLAEYEEGDKIRILPCRHEYHMSCVDKWLKEIHGVCPLCRGDVCAGVAEGSISNS